MILKDIPELCYINRYVTDLKYQYSFLNVFFLCKVSKFDIFHDAHVGT